LTVATGFALAAFGLAGCAADRPLQVRIGEDIARPQRAAVVFFIDGFGQAQFDQALADGRIPNIDRHILKRGVRVERAVSCIPSITYANSVTFLTGLYPGHHGIVANKWFEPSTGRFQDYDYIKTYQRVDGDYAAPTIYEILPDRVAVSIQTAIRRGCTHPIDNWATSGINWFFGNISGVDSLVAQRFELIGELTPRWGRWPELIWVYFPGADNFGHRFGPDSRQYQDAVANVDRQIGHICKGLQDIGMYEQTYLVLVSDHGMVRVDGSHAFDIDEFLANRTGAKVWADRCTEPGEEQRLRRDYDFVVATTASRWTAVYPIAASRHPASLAVRKLAEDLHQIEEHAGQSSPPARDEVFALLPDWLREAVDHPAVELAACSFRRGAVHLLTRGGYALVTRTDGPDARYAVRQSLASPVVEPDLLPTDPNAADSRAWLAATIGSRYPDLVPQIAALFDSERAGSIVFFAAEGWDFSTEDPAGGHGSILAADVRVPMLFAGPGLPAGATIPLARNCDVMPTLLHLLGGEPLMPDGRRVDIDGVNLLPSSPRQTGVPKEEPRIAY
jgi:arylsulfatase A-like enzyme